MLCISSFQLNKPCTQESRTGQCHSDTHSAKLADTVLVPSPSETIAQVNPSAFMAQGLIDSTLQGGATPIGQTIEVDGLLCIRQALRERGLSEDTISLIMSSWRKSTRSQYNTYINKWIKFCHDSHRDVCSPSVEGLLEFLNLLYTKGLRYSAINTARSAMSSFASVMVNESLGTNPLVIRLLRGVARNRPSLPRYQSIWDVGQVLTYFKKQLFVQYLPLYELTLRTVMLVALVSAQRCQSLHMLSLNNMTITNTQYCFTITGDYKQAKTGSDTLKIVLPAYPDDIRLCVFTTLNEYVTRTADLRHDDQLFISTVKPYRAVSRDTIARWIKSILTRAGVDTSIFKPHSTRSASVSTALRNGADLQTILNAAGWSNETTFANYYNKPLHVTVTKKLYASSLLM